MHRDNAFDFIRFAAALTVVVSHSFILSGNRSAWLDRIDPGHFAVLVFFALSGYLLANSWEQDPDARRFLMRRALRIYPGLGAMVLLCVFVLGPALSTVDLHAYFSGDGTWRYLRRLIVPDGGGHLPGVFEGNPVPNWVNAPLWTLKYEIGLYVVFALMGALGAWRTPRLAFPATAGALMLMWAGHLSGLVPPIDVLFETGRTDHIAEFGTIFFGGAALHHFRSALPAIRLPDAMRRFGRHGDWSFGIYIYGWPVHQSVAMLAPNWGWAKQCGASVFLTLVCAALSWHLIENRALRLKHLLRRARDRAGSRGHPIPAIDKASAS